MIAKHIAGANANPGAPADWNPARDGNCGRLPIRVTRDGAHVKHCESAWEPTPNELALLNAGGQVVLRVVGWQVPVALYVEGPAEGQTVRKLVEVLEGWMMVPIQPNPDMLKALGGRCDNDVQARELWRDTLKSVPAVLVRTGG